MRIAFSGSHQVGKSSLIAELRRTWPECAVLEEPYYELLDQGHDFSDPPSADDFAAQLQHSIERICSDPAANRLYDRCPADFLAYMAALNAHDLIRTWLARAADAMATLDLVVFVPVENPDRIGSTHAHARLRRRVDDLLREILLDDSYGFGLPVVEVQGPIDARAAQVLDALRESQNRP